MRSRIGGMTLTLLLVTAACSPRDIPPADLASFWSGAPDTATTVVVVLEPGVCLGCSAPPPLLDELRKCHHQAVVTLWRREPRNFESRRAAPLRLSIAGTLKHPFPKQPPSGPIYVFYRSGVLWASADHLETQHLDSLLRSTHQYLSTSCALDSSTASASSPHRLSSLGSLLRVDHRTARLQRC